MLKAKPDLSKETHRKLKSLQGTQSYLTEDDKTKIKSLMAWYKNKGFYSVRQIRMAKVFIGKSYRNSRAIKGTSLKGYFK